MLCRDIVHPYIPKHPWEPWSQTRGTATLGKKDGGYAPCATEVSPEGILRLAGAKPENRNHVCKLLLLSSSWTLLRCFSHTSSLVEIAIWSSPGISSKVTVRGHNSSTEATKRCQKAHTAGQRIHGTRGRRRRCDVYMIRQDPHDNVSLCFMYRVFVLLVRGLRYLATDSYRRRPCCLKVLLYQIVRKFRARSDVARGREGSP